jgi:ABC-type antimicrobial peptide transport system permease subunit
MAVRLAVGAARGRVLLMMLRESAALAAMGCVCGAVTAVLAGRVTQSMFVGTSSADPLVLGSAGIVMLLVAVLATWLPAHGASRTDPNTLLRAE